MISFTSLTYIFRFLPAFLILYYAVPSRFRNFIIIIGSLFFYAMGEPIFIALLVGLILINFFVADAGYRIKNKTSKGNRYRHKHKMKAFCAIAVTIDVLSLVAFKVLATFVDNALLPLGLSFYIFKMISYQVDVYKGTIPVRPKFIDTVAHFSVFTQITQGPIMRYEDGAYYNNKYFSIKNIEEGLKYFIIGFAMKVILADRIGILFNDLGMYGYQSITTPLAWLGAFAYSFQLYFDFWGYSLMAEGVMVAMGFDFIQNFDSPYASKSISEFYRRWHMTLGSFFRDYVYFPLGGSKCSKGKMVFNLAIVWILTGIWHGNGINFLIWGAVLGVFIILEKLFYGKTLSKIPILGNLYVLIVIPLSWVVFAIKDLGDLGSYFSRLFPFIGSQDAVVNGNDFLEYLGDYWWMFVVAIILCIPKTSQLYEKHKNKWYVIILLLVVFWIGVYFSASTEGNPFMYLNF